jgi:UDPglucose--hexose-1-phosphate uridylyltransferase
MTEYRRDPITGRWVIVVPGRAARPNEHAAAAPDQPTGTDCPFCEGNESRTPPEVAAVGEPGRAPNGRGWHVRTIPNRFPTVIDSPAEPDPRALASGFESRRGFGYHEVIIESPSHAPLLPFLPSDQVRRILRMWRDRVRALSGRENVGSVTLFENAGPESGGSLWHPHSQLVATSGRTPALAEEIEGAESYRRNKGCNCALEDVGRAEEQDGERILFRSPEYLAYAPFASAYPYEVRVLPTRHTPSFAGATDPELDLLAERLPQLLRAVLTVIPGGSYNLLVRSPAGPSLDSERYHWHLDICPRAIRPDGFDLGSGFHVNAVSPEGAAEALRAALGAKH